MLRALSLSALTLTLGLTCSTVVCADNRDEDGDDNRPLSVAVFGDWPYSQNLLNNAPLLIKSVNSDRAVRRVIHVGDIHSGSMPCTSAGILPPIATSNPYWNQQVYSRFQQFEAPVVYTPGDNEWTDCHKKKEFFSGAPLKELASVRGLFFAKPGVTLGLNEAAVATQAKRFEAAFPSDAQFVENLMWQQSRVVFVTLNMPGSNNDGLNLPWSNPFSDPVAQGQEALERTAADLRWLDAAFARATRQHAKGIVIALQADRWDPAAISGDGLDGYTPLVQKLATLSIQFGRPVLLFNGDSHVFGADQPLADPTSDTGKIHGTPAVPNLTRITVQGSTRAPAEWLRLTIEPSSPEVFSWRNVAYCANPTSATCQ